MEDISDESLPAWESIARKFNVDYKAKLINMNGTVTSIAPNFARWGVPLNNTIFIVQRVL